MDGTECLVVTPSTLQSYESHDTHAKWIEVVFEPSHLAQLKMS